MKRVLLICSILLTLLLSACGASEVSTVYTVTKNNVDYVVDTENETISDGKYEYSYEFSGNKSEYSVRIKYPDGAVYSSSVSDSWGSGSWSNGWREKGYADEDVLTDVLLEGAPKEIQLEKGLAALFLAGMGVFCIMSPESVWHLNYGWRFKNAEPSDMALGFNRMSGLIAVIAAVILLFT